MRFKKLRKALRLYEKGVINMTSPEAKQHIAQAYGHLDPSLEHIQGHLFYSKHVIWELLERTPVKNMPNTGIIFNLKTKQAFLISEQALKLMAEQKIEWVTSNYENLEQACSAIKNITDNLGLKMNWRLAVADDLKEA